MKCKDEFEYMMLLVNDYLNTLPASSKVAVAPQAQRCATAIATALQEEALVAPVAVPTAVSPSTPAGATPAPVTPALVTPAATTPDTTS